MTIPEDTSERDPASEDTTNAAPQTYTVHFTQFISISVPVEATDTDAAVELAYDEAPGGICALCGGWGKRWSRDDSGEMEAEAVTDAAGNTVWQNGLRWTQVPDKADDR